MTEKRFILSLEALRDFLVRAYLGAQEVPPIRRAIALGPERDAARAEAEAIATSLIDEAYRHGFGQPLRIHIDHEDLEGGLAAQFVFKVETKASCVAKVDNDRELALEAVALRRIAETSELPPEHKRRFPTVYAMKTDSPPYCYIMEHFPEPEFVSLGNLLFRQRIDDVESIGDAIGRVLGGLYEASAVPRLKPNIRSVYVDSIRDSLETGASRCDEFADILRRTPKTHGGILDTYVACLNRIGTNVASFEGSCATFMHGDAHGGNILVWLECTPLDLKFIDVKHWMTGDYLYDLGRLIAWLEVSGPYQAAARKPAPDYDPGQETFTIDYAVPEVPAAMRLSAKVRDMAESLGGRLGDRNWNRRLELSTATSLLSFASWQLRSEAVDFGAALAFYAEGIRRLNKCVRSFST